MPIVNDEDDNKRKIRGELINAYRITEGFPIKGWMLDGYMEVLGKCDYDTLKKVIGNLLRSNKTNKFPSPGWLLEEYNTIVKRERMQAVPGQVREYSKIETSFKAVVMSNMYLHYNNGWDVSQQQCIKDAYEKLYPGEVYDFNRFTERVTKEKVDAYVARFQN